VFRPARAAARKPRRQTIVANGYSIRVDVRPAGTAIEAVRIPERTRGQGSATRRRPVPEPPACPPAAAPLLGRPPAFRPRPAPPPVVPPERLAARTTHAARGLRPPIATARSPSRRGARRHCTTAPVSAAGLHRQKPSASVLQGDADGPPYPTAELCRGRPPLLAPDRALLVSRLIRRSDNAAATRIRDIVGDRAPSITGPRPPPVPGCAPLSATAALWAHPANRPRDNDEAHASPRAPLVGARAHPPAVFAPANCLAPDRPVRSAGAWARARPRAAGRLM